jgi:hypothetical protein
VTRVEPTVVLVRVSGEPGAQQSHDPLGNAIDELVNDRKLG